MRYFTRALYRAQQVHLDFESDGPDCREARDRAGRLWDRALEAYRAELDRISSELPPDLLLLCTEVSNHDFRLGAFSTSGADRAELLLHPFEDPPNRLPSRKLVMTGETEATGVEACPGRYWLYEEASIADDGRFELRVLCDQGEFQLRFRDLELVEVHPSSSR